MKVAVLIPAYNEGETIASTIRAVAEISPVEEIVIINDGSTDSTGDIALQEDKFTHLKLTVINLADNLGKGGALNLGIQETIADVYLLLDADLGQTASLAQNLLDPILSNQADMTIASFSQGQTASKKMGFGLVLRTARLGVNLLTGVRVQSPLSGQRALTKDVLSAVGPLFSGFGVEIGLTVGAIMGGFTILEVPLPMKHRGYGRGLRGIRHRARQFLHVLRALWTCHKKGWFK